MAVSKAARQAFARRLADLREEHELTQVQLGKQVGVTGTCVWNWESGNTFPRPPAMSKLARALGTSVDYLSIGNGPATHAEVGDPRSVTEIIEEARDVIARAAGVPVKKVRVVIDYGE